MIDEIKELVEKLNKASDEYYNNKSQSMTDSEWDKDFDKLNLLENKSGIKYSNSPTQNAGYVVADYLDKIKHSTPLLSLGKTKSIDDLLKFLGNREGCLMFKLDGGTQVIDYKGIDLNYLATRGSSSTNEGQDITHNSSAIIGIPKKLMIENIQVIGEGIMYKSKLEEINLKLDDGNKYANARNLANATSSMLDSKRASEREVRFVAFSTLGREIFKTKMNELEHLKSEGFTVVEHVLVNKSNLREEVERMTQLREFLDYDIDGLVLAHNDLEYGLSLGKTSHHFKNAIAYKFGDEEVETILTNIITDVGKSGQISYVGEFETVELCGTQVSKASLSNYSLISQLQLGIGDSIMVRKANEIIPQITDNLTRSETYKKILRCPVCDSELTHKGVHQFCNNFGCDKQILGRLVHFCSRDAMDIRGMSEETIKAIMTIKFNEDGILGGRPVIYTPSDIYELPKNKEVLYELDRFGKKKVDNICKAIENSKTRPMNNVLYAMSIPQVGRTASKKIAEKYLSMDNLLDSINRHELIKLVGDSVGNSFIKYITNLNFTNELRMLQRHGLTMTQEENKIVINSDSQINDKTFVVTGSVSHFKNRKELQLKIEELGGKISSGVSKNTDFLLNNDTTSTSGKNKKAKELNIQIISEDDFLEMIK